MGVKNFNSAMNIRIINYNKAFILKCFAEGGNKIGVGVAYRKH